MSLPQRFKVLLFESDPETPAQEKGAVLDLPFPPFPHLWVMVPWRLSDYHEITQVYWDSKEEHFVAYFDSPDSIHQTYDLRRI